MKLILMLSLFVSGWTLALALASEEGGLLHPLRRAVQRIAGDYFGDPILLCPYCMPSLHGALIFVLYHARNHLWGPWYWMICDWALLVCISSVLNYIIFNLIRLLVNAPDHQPVAPCSEVTGIEATLSNPKNEV